MANNLANFIPQLWSQSVINNIDQVNLALAVMANTTYEGEVNNFGDTVNVRTFGSVTVQDYERGMTTASEDLVPVKESLSVNKSKYFQFEVDDLDRVQNDINAVQGYTGRAGVAMSNALDTFGMTFYSSALTANQLSNSGSAYDISANTSGTAIYELLVNAGQKLDEQNVDSSQRWAIISPYAKALILKSTTYLIRATDLGDAIVQTAHIGMGADRRNMVASEAMQRGFIGQMAGFDVYVSNNLYTTATGKYFVYGQGKPLCYVSQLSPGSVEAIRRQDSFATIVRGLMLYGAAVFAEDSKRLGYIYGDLS